MPRSRALHGAAGQGGHFMAWLCVARHHGHRTAPHGTAQHCVAAQVRHGTAQPAPAPPSHPVHTSPPPTHAPGPPTHTYAGSLRTHADTCAHTPMDTPHMCAWARTPITPPKETHPDTKGHPELANATRAREAPQTQLRDTIMRPAVANATKPLNFWSFPPFWGLFAHF